MEHQIVTASALLWSFLLTLLAYIAFVLREIISAGSDRAIGIGVFPYVLTRPSFWLTAAALTAFVLWWKLH